MTDDASNPTAPGPEGPVEPAPDAAAATPRPEEAVPPTGARSGTRSPLTGAPLPPPTTPRPPSSADVSPRRPDYKGAELDPERGPGLGCFWFQVIVLGFFIVLIPIGLNLGWPFEVLAILLFVVIGLLLLTGQTVIFLLRLVAADRRTQGRRRPLASSTKTVGEMEDAIEASAAAEGGPPGDGGSGPGPAAPAEASAGGPGTPETTEGEDAGAAGAVASGGDAGAVAAGRAAGADTADVAAADAPRPKAPRSRRRRQPESGATASGAQPAGSPSTPDAPPRGPSAEPPGVPLPEPPVAPEDPDRGVRQ